MDGRALVFGIFLIVLMTIGWIVKKLDTTRIKNFFSGFPGFLRWSLSVASAKDLEEMQFQFKTFRNQLETRLKELETPRPSIDSTDTPFESCPFPSGSFQEDSLTFGGLKQIHSSSSSQQTIICLGLRFTLNELLWAYAGRTNIEVLTDRQISSMIQGPFCPKCLKRIVERDEEDQPSVLPNKCGFCGQWWSQSDVGERNPLQIKDLKRWVFNKLDQEIRTQFNERSSKV